MFARSFHAKKIEGELIFYDRIMTVANTKLILRRVML